jgi:hypothetical protein
MPVIKNCLECGKEMKVKPSLVERRKYCSRRCMGKNSKLARGLIDLSDRRPWNEGLKGVTGHWNKGRRGLNAGAKNGNWKGGKTALMDQIRTCAEYKKWRTAVFKRDGFHCVKCGVGGDVQADHIYPLAKLVDDYGICSLVEALEAKGLWDIENGRTLCGECHKKTPTFGVNFIRWNKETIH